MYQKKKIKIGRLKEPKIRSSLTGIGLMVLGLFFWTSHAHALEKPVPVSPASEVAAPVVFAWAPVEEAQTYWVWVVDNSDDSTYLEAAYYTADVLGCAGGEAYCRLSPALEFPAGAYTVMVRAKNNDAISGAAHVDFSVVTQVIPAGPEILVPVNNTAQESLDAYQWASVSNAASYQLRVAGGGHDTVVDQTADTVVLDTFTPAVDAGCEFEGNCRYLTAAAPVLEQGDYTAWVRALSGNGETETIGEWSDGVQFSIGTKPLMSPDGVVLTSPDTAATVDNPVTFTWQAAAGATWYAIWVNDADGIRFKKWYTAAQAGCASGTGACGVTPGTLLVPGEAAWWVQPWNEAGTGPWSEGNEFEVAVPASAPDAPAATTPDNTTVGTPVTYAWQASAGATWYRLWVNDDTGRKLNQWYRAEDLGCDAGTGTCEVTPDVELAQGQGSWWVKAWNSSGSSPWSEKKSFTSLGQGPGMARLISPDGTTEVNPVTFTWEPVTGSVQYQLWVNDGADITVVDRLVDAEDAGCSPGTCSFILNSDLDIGYGFNWWIRAENTYGEKGPWSKGKGFSVGKPVSLPGTPVPTSPKDGEEVTNPVTCTWAPVEAADQYQLTILDSTGGEAVKNLYSAADAGCSSGTDACAVSVTGTTLGGGGYTWQVQAKNEAGFGESSESASFQIEAASGAVLVEPSGDMADGLPDFTWEPVSGAVEYTLEVQMEKSPDKTGTISYETVIDETGSPSNFNCDTYCIKTLGPSSALSNGVYIWRVSTLDTQGSETWSNQQTFSVCPDADNDGYYRFSECSQSQTGDDCDDDDPDINPGAREVCGNRVDEDCDGVAASCNCVDADGDGYDKYDAVSCTTGTDCDDTNDQIHPGMIDDNIGTEQIGIDNDCDGEIDEDAQCPDADNDGYYTKIDCGSEELDCDDTDPNVHPGAVEICNDRIDNDCDGKIDDIDGGICGIRVPDTGQNRCYGESWEPLAACPSSSGDYTYGDFFGQDACYSINPLAENFVKLDSDGEVLSEASTSWAMVKDKSTGLIWEIKTDNGGIHDKDRTYNWEDARTVFINSLNAQTFGGLSTWRLPTMNELATIVNYGYVFNPVSLSDYFPNTASGKTAPPYITINPVVGNTPYVWGINFYQGEDQKYLKSQTAYVRAVYKAGCQDLDGDGYSAISSDCGSGTDCDDTNPDVNPGVTVDLCGDNIDSDCSGSDAACPTADIALPDTGQIRCYGETWAPLSACPLSPDATENGDFFGQDASYSINPLASNYTKLNQYGEAVSDTALNWTMVKDEATGLIWEVKKLDNSIHNADNTYTWEEASQAVKDMNTQSFGGYVNWRLPTMKELTTIINYGYVFNPVVIMDYFPNTVSGRVDSPYITRDEVFGSTDYVWGVNFYQGEDQKYPKTEAGYLRAVFKACEDLDQDGYYTMGCDPSQPVDCDDSDPSVNPGAQEICGDGIDNDCDGTDCQTEAE